MNEAEFTEFKKRCEKWLAKAYSKATTPEQFKAIANLAELKPFALRCMIF